MQIAKIVRSGEPGVDRAARRVRGGREGEMEVSSRGAGASICGRSRRLSLPSENEWAWLDQFCWPRWDARSSSTRSTKTCLRRFRAARSVLQVSVPSGHKCHRSGLVKNDRTESLNNQHADEGREVTVVALSSIVACRSCWFGALKSSRPEARLLEKLAAMRINFTVHAVRRGRTHASAAAGAGDALRDGLARSIGAVRRTLIAGQALARDLTLVTHNTREFARVPGLRLEDWEG